MELTEAISQRRSVRAFKPTPVPLKILRDILEKACRAPSGSNTQPWGFAIATGKKLEEIKQGFSARLNDPLKIDFPMLDHYPDPYDSRRRDLAKTMLDIQGIAREDKERRTRWLLEGLNLFGAPAAIYLYIDRGLYTDGKTVNVWPFFDLGMVAENILLLATAQGLGTVLQLQAVMHSDVLRKVLEIPDSKLIFVGMAIGYPDWESPINQLRTGRLPLDEVTKWHGFE